MPLSYLRLDADEASQVSRRGAAQKKSDKRRRNNGQQESDRRWYPEVRQTSDALQSRREHLQVAQREAARSLAKAPSAIDEVTWLPWLSEVSNDVRNLIRSQIGIARRVSIWRLFRKIGRFSEPAKRTVKAFSLLQ